MILSRLSPCHPVTAKIAGADGVYGCVCGDNGTTVTKADDHWPGFFVVHLGLRRVPGDPPDLWSAAGADRTYGTLDR